MAVDLEAIRRRVAELSGQRRNSSVQLWKPAPGEYRVRGIPWKNGDPSLPLIERQFYYIGDNGRILAPSQFGKPDPINALIRKLYSSGKPEDRDLAKQLQPKMTAYMAVIVRGEEDKGVQVWACNKFAYQRLLGFFSDADVGDYLDPLTGFDLKVSITKSAKMFNGKAMMDTVIDPARKQTKLSDNDDQMKKWLDSTPNIDDMWQQKSVTEIENMLNTWLSGGVADTTTHGTERGSKPKDDLDTIVDEIKGEPKPAAAAEPVKAKRATDAKKPKADIDDDAPVAKKQSVDDAFAELMEEPEA